MDTKDLEVQAEENMSYLALDLGGSLIKLVYFSRKSDIVDDDDDDDEDIKYPLLQGRLHFAKFKNTNDLNDCLDFISTNKLHLHGSHHKAPRENIIVKATGGGANKYSGLFKEKLGICLEYEDEIGCLVAGASFMLKTIPEEAFTYMNGETEYVQIDNNDLYPYLLVNAGTAATFTKVYGDGQFELLGGLDIGGGTFMGLGRLLTNCNSFDELVELSQRGNNKAIDVLIGDTYGGIDYSMPGKDLKLSLVASGFGKPMYDDNKSLEDYKPQDIACSLLRMISNNIGQVACMTVRQLGLKRIFICGSFIRSHAVMDTISATINFWTRGEPKAMFMRHEGFLCAMGAFLKYKRLDDIKMYCGKQNGDLFDDQTIECSVDAA